MSWEEIIRGLLDKMPRDARDKLIRDLFRELYPGKKKAA